MRNGAAGRAHSGDLKRRKTDRRGRTWDDRRGENRGLSLARREPFREYRRAENDRGRFSRRTTRSVGRFRQGRHYCRLLRLLSSTAPQKILAITQKFVVDRAGFEPAAFRNLDHQLVCKPDILRPDQLVSIPD